MTSIYLHKYDLPENIQFKDSVAIDTETTGLCIRRDQLCLVQLSSGNGVAHLIQINKDFDPVNLKKLLSDKNILKIFHYARFDVAMLYYHLDIFCESIYCTKIASKIARTNARYHGLKEICKEILSIEIFKQQQCSNWANDKLTKEQQNYAASDVLYLHQIKEKLDEMIIKVQRSDVCKLFMKQLPTIIRLDLFKEKFMPWGWDSDYIFSHNS